MQAPRYPWKTVLIGSGRPTVGNLMDLCEENYRALLRLVPDLRGLQGEACSVVGRDQDLFLEVLEQAPYTTLLRLTYYFPHHDGKLHRTPDPDPDTLLRAYHDAGQVEVLGLRQTALPVHTHYPYPALEAKWKVNLFLSRWLAFCLARGYRFSTEPEAPVNPAAKALAPILL
ncbi:DUF1249 domain-containing protein [Candidatus Thiosymbion oneisti]|uniref:DUF1249 domain-containing protein n=1 Tax=Candidatus Thiosymbion oneisti TaxID=589554 RepID=UPI000A845067|nr:DUF1249 domain-containing protein [Candidatus Thiosymbion oneisti]